MLVTNLSKEELQELKKRYLIELDNEGKLEEVAGIKAISYGIIANIDDIVPDSVEFNHYDGIMFVKDDFFCNCA